MTGSQMTGHGGSATCFATNIYFTSFDLRSKLKERGVLRFMFSTKRQTAKILTFGIGLALVLFTTVLYLQKDQMASKLVGLEFEVYGRVQGVFFRKFTQERGRKLGLTGWCRNTDRGTVLGYVEGDKAKIEEMKRWLLYTGSPQSQIEKTEFRNEKEITQNQFSDFKVTK